MPEGFVKRIKNNLNINVFLGKKVLAQIGIKRYKNYYTHDIFWGLYCMKYFLLK